MSEARQEWMLMRVDLDRNASDTNAPFAQGQRARRSIAEADAQVMA